ncbi:unnamed protein product, partial [marine sediment metagenome]
YKTLSHLDVIDPDAKAVIRRVRDLLGKRGVTCRTYKDHEEFIAGNPSEDEA